MNFLSKEQLFCETCNKEIINNGKVENSSLECIINQCSNKINYNELFCFKHKFKNGTKMPKNWCFSCNKLNYTKCHHDGDLHSSEIFKQCYKY